MAVAGGGDQPEQQASSRRRSRLILLSGGIDSTYLLKHALAETDDVVIAHHVQMINREGRHEAEDGACRRIVEHCRERYRPFYYSESAVDRRGFRAPGFDVITVAGEGGIAASNYLLATGAMPDIWMLGLNLEEWRAISVEQHSSDPETILSRENLQASDRTYHVIAAMAAACFPNAPPKYVWPEIKPKRDLIDYLGPELAALCWTCRRPEKRGDGFVECGACKTCLLMRSIK